MVTFSFVKTIAVLFALFSLASCIGAPRTEFRGPNGKMVYAISCQTMDDCAIRAREFCPSGHDIVPARLEQVTRRQEEELATRLQ